MTRAMIVGARGYLIKPFSSDDLINTVRAAAAVTVPIGDPGSSARGPVMREQGGESRLRKIIAIYSPKGGVGRSVIAANFAITLRKETNKRVVLVDGNLQSGDAHVLLNLNVPNTIDDLREAGSLDQELINSAVATHEASGIGLLRAPIDPGSAELFNADAMKAILVELREHFDYLVIDTDTSFSEATLTMLDMADVILLVTTLEVTTINRVTQFYEVMDRLSYSKSKVKLICNRVDHIYGIQPRHVETRLRQHFLAQIPEDEGLVVTSVNRGVPFVLSHKNAPITKAVLALVQRVITLNPTPAEGGGGGEKKRWGR
jgi:pilus assembly protein CpaE